MNERGNVTLYGLFLLIVVSLISLHFIKLRVEETADNQKLQKILLCAKESNGVIKSFYDEISRSNKFLKALTVTEYTTITIPIYGIIASKSAAQAKKVIKSIQLTQLFSHLNKLRALAAKNCYLSLNAYKTPYRLSLPTGFKRNQYDEAMLRGEQWQYANMSEENTIRNQIKTTPSWSIKSSIVRKGWRF